MTKEQRILAFDLLGKYLSGTSSEWTAIKEAASHHNPWFTAENVENALCAWGTNLNADRLHNWVDSYGELPDSPKVVGLILAGNIPIVGFHDILSVLIAGFAVQVKMASADQILTKHLLGKLIEIEPDFESKISIVEKLGGYDLIIATGSNNSARYFEYYFGKKPHIIRKNRNSVAVLDGRETREELQRLGHDVFDYFGLGCRNVSKIYFPKGFDVAHFYEGIASFEQISEHYKYNNNYDYHKSIYLVNGDQHFDNGFLLLKQDERMASPLAVIHYEEYETLPAVTQALKSVSDALQCVVSKIPLNIPAPVVDFGQSQQPALNDYADGVDTLAFLETHR